MPIFNDAIWLASSFPLSLTSCQSCDFRPPSNVNVAVIPGLGNRESAPSWKVYGDGAD